MQMAPRWKVLNEMAIAVIFQYNEIQENEYIFFFFLSSVIIYDKNY